MSIEGNINTVDLASVFQMLFNNRREGVLIVDGTEKKHIYFTSGGVTVLCPPDQLGADVGLALLRERKITPDQLNDLKQHAAHKQERLFDVLLHGTDSFGEEEATRVFGRIVEEELCEVLAWGKANFQFHSGTSPEDYKDTVMPVPFVISDIDWIVLESVRRMDEWTLIKRMIPSVREIYRSAGQAPARYDEIGGENGRLIYSLVDGQASVEEIIEASYLTKFEVSRTLAHFLEDGIIIQIPREELIARAAELHRRNHLEGALKFYLRAIAAKEDDIDLRIKVAEVLQKAKRTEAAADHYRVCAEQSLASHRIDVAFEFYKKVAQLLPRDIDSREKMVDLFVEYRADYDLKCPNLIEDGMNVASRLATQGDGERAVQLLRKLISIKETNLSLRAQLINISLKLGNADEAISEYEDLARQFFQRGNLESAAKIYDKILCIDGTRKDVFEKLKNLEELVARRKTSRQRKRIIAYVAAGATFLGVTFFLYYRASERAFNDLHITELVRNNKYQEAVAALDGFRENFPLSPITMTAAVEKERVVQLSVDKIRDDRESRREKSLELTALLEKALVWVDDGNLPEAYKAFQELASTGDPAFLRRHKILEKVEEVDVYLKGAREVLAQAKQFEEDRDYAHAHLSYRKLFSEYPLSDVLSGVTLPFYVTSEPAGATIVLNGEVTSLTTPSLVRVSPNGEVPVDVRLAGFSAERILLGKSETWLANIDLKRAPLWTRDTGGPITGACEVDDSVAFVGNRGAKLEALRIADGKELWSTDLPGIADIEGAVVVENGMVFAGANDMIMRAFDRGTGATLWSFKTDGFVKASPLLFDRHLVLATSKGTLYSVSKADGRELWKHSMGAEITSGIVTDGETIYLATVDGEVHGVQSKTGKAITSFACQDAVHGDPLVVNRTLMVGCDDGQVYAFDLFSGRPRWKFKTGGKIRGGLLQRGSMVFAGSADGYFYCLDLETGQMLTRYQTGAPIVSRAAFGDELVYVASEEGVVHALDPASLRRRWKTQLPGKITADLTVEEKVLFVPCLSGSLYAFAAEFKKIQ